MALSNLKNKKIIISAGGSGIGWATAKIFLSKGASVYLCDNDIKLGEIGGVPFYMNGDQYEKWKHTDLTIDAVSGIGGMFSLDNGTGRRFLTKSEICLVVDNDKKN